MAYQILINKKPMKNAISRKALTFETREQAEAMAISHRTTFAQPTFSNAPSPLRGGIAIDPGQWRNPQ